MTFLPMLMYTVTLYAAAVFGTDRSAIQTRKTVVARNKNGRDCAEGRANAGYKLGVNGLGDKVRGIAHYIRYWPYAAAMGATTVDLDHLFGGRLWPHSYTALVLYIGLFLLSCYFAFGGRLPGVGVLRKRKAKAAASLGPSPGPHLEPYPASGN